MSGPRKIRGSLTVFLALLLPAFLVFTGTCLEYARAQALSYQVQAAATSAVQSVFAGYSSPLLSQYQLTARLVAQGDFDALAEESGRYVSAYGGEEGGCVSFQETELLWQDLVFVTDDHGAVFAALVGEAMTASAVELVAEEWVERLGLAGDTQQTETLTDNAVRDTLSADDLLSGYTEWEASVEAAETSQAEASGGTDKESQEDISGETGDSQGISAGEEDFSVEADSGAEEQNAADRERGATFLEVLAALRQALQHGILGLVLPEGRSISSGTISGSDLPSSLSEEVKSRSVGDSLSSTGDSLLLREYLMRNLDCFTSESGKSPAYELEYVLAGKSTDEANLRAAVTRILWMRTGMNLLYLSQSAEKKAQLQEAAALAVGWLGQPALVTGMAALLQIAWAFSESLVDVRSLLAGGKIALAKTDESWTLSLDHLAEIWTRETASLEYAEEEGEEEGLSYEDYLRICLYLTAEETCCYRAMDVIQWNVQKVDPSFILSDCVVSGTLCLTAEASPLFTPLYGYVAGTGAFTYTKSDQFSYLT